MNPMTTADEWVQEFAKNMPESIAMLGTSVMRDMFTMVQRDALEAAAAEAKQWDDGIGASRAILRMKP